MKVHQQKLLIRHIGKCSFLAFLFASIFFSLPVYAQEISGDFSAGGSIKIADDSRGCDTSNTEGSIRYNVTDDRMEFCDGSQWHGFQFSAPTSCGGAIAANNNVYSDSTYTGAFSYTVGTAGTNRLLVVSFMVEGNTANPVTAVTFDGNPMTEAGEISTGSGPNTTSVSQWYLAVDEDLGAGSHTGNIVVTTAGTSGLRMVAVDYLINVDGANPIAETSTNSGSGSSISTTYTVAANTMTVDVTGNSDNDPVAPNNGQTELAELVRSGPNSAMAYGVKSQGSAGSQTLGWTSTGSGRQVIVSSEVNGCS